MRKLLILVLILSIWGSVFAADDKVTYTGGVLESKAIGIMILSDDKKEAIAVTSPVYHYGFIIPYLENWVFEKTEQYYLFGNNGIRNISIDILKLDNIPDADFLGTFKENLLKNTDKNGVETADFLTANKIMVLKTVVDAGKVTKQEEFKNIKQQNLFITKTNVEARYVLHFSMIMNDHSQAEFDRFLDYLTRSFATDFMLE